MARGGGFAQDGDAGGASSSTDKTVPLRRSARNLRANGSQTSREPAPDEPSTSRTCPPSRRRAPASEHSTSATAGPSSAPIASPSSAPPQTQQTTPPSDPKTPNKTGNDSAKTKPFPFTPATGTQIETAYHMADKRDRTRKTIYEANRQRAEGLCVVTRTIEEWLEHCLPKSTYSEERSPEALKGVSVKVFQEVSTTRNETQFHEAIVKSGVLKRLLSKDTHLIRGEDINDPSQKYSPDWTACSSDVDLEVPGPFRARIILQKSEGDGELKAEDEDPTKDTPKGRQSFGQLITYVHVTSTNSHRTWKYSFTLTPKHGYLFFFDRGAIIRSAPFEWRDTGYLLSFLSRFDAMTPAERGWDTAVQLIPPTHDDALRAKELLSKRRKALRYALPQGITHATVFPRGQYGDLSRFYLFDSETRVIHRVIAHRPFDCDTSSYLGSGIRWWIGVDLRLERVVLFKSYWRIALPTVPSESDVYRSFDRSVEHALEFGYGGDVLVDGAALWDRYHDKPIPLEVELAFQSTRTHDLITKHQEWDRPKSVIGRKDGESVEVLRRTHHVSVFFTVVRKLRTFRNPRELVQVLHDATDALQKAHDKGILHRNLTASSIGIDNQGRGRVMNWDWTDVVTRNLSSARTRSRPISLQFSSAEQLQQPWERPHLLRDDLESIIHLLWFHALRYLPHAYTQKMTRSTILQAMRHIYESAAVNSENEIEAGRDKGAFLGGKHTLNEDELGGGVIQPALLWRVMRSSRRIFHPLYATRPVVEEDMEPEDLEGVKEKQELWDESHKKAKEELSSAAPLLKIFTNVLAKDWPQSAPPADQYTPTSLPSTNFSSFTGNIANSSTRTSTKRSRSYVPGPNNLPEPKRLKSSPDDVFGPVRRDDDQAGEELDRGEDDDVENGDTASEEAIFSLQEF
ncbi:unnamed protein product [Peniophora sp. CBMAI 1063]|nr:unnamed protein product [Peniophora sp. CBMAI 1063]